MALDTKYGRVTLEHGTIGEHEPVVVFRAQDALLPELLDVYWARCQAAGSPQSHLDGLDATKATVEAWQRAHHAQVPKSAKS